MEQQLVDAKEYLKGMDQDEIMAVLGKPDATQLAKRNQKYYIYYLSNLEKCSNEAKTSKKLSIRFSAVGLAYEIIII